MPRHKLGKRIGTKIWVHAAYLDDLLDDLGVGWALKLRNLYWERLWERTYDVLRLDTAARTLAFIQCPGFDDNPEPVVGESLLIYPGENTGSPLRLKSTPGLKFVYHHRHLFVGPGYKGFDLEKSWRRGAVIEQLKREGLLDSRRMGAVSYWRDHVHLVEERL